MKSWIACAEREFDRGDRADREYRRSAGRLQRSGDPAPPVPRRVGEVQFVGIAFEGTADGATTRTPDTEIRTVGFFVVQ